MRKRNKSTVITFRAEGGADLGPALRLRRDGRFQHWGGAAEVLLETRDDPEITDRRRSIRGARRRDVLLDLAARRIITRRMHHAAEQFMEDCSIATGATAAEEIGLSSLAGPRVGLPERQVSALVRIMQARQAVDLERGTIFWHVLFENGSLGDFEEHNQLRNGTASGMLRNVLNALDEHYHRTMTRKAS